MKRLTVLALLAAAGCPAPPVTPEASGPAIRAAHLARLPADAESVGQADLDRLFDAGRARAWVARVEAAMEGSPGSGCLVDLADRIGVVTVAMHPAGRRYNAPEEIAVQVAGDVTAADVAGCAARLVPELFGDLADAAEQGRIVLVGDGPGAWVAIDLPEGGVLVAQAMAADAMLAAAAPAEGSAPPLLGALEAIAPGADLVARVASPIDIPDGPRIHEVTLAVHRGTPDRYVVTARMESAEDATMVAQMAVPMAMFSLAMIGSDLAQERTRGGPPAELLDALIALIEALGPVLETAVVETDGDRVVATFEADPATLHPTDLILGGAAMTLVFASPGGTPAGQPAVSLPPDARYAPEGDGAGE